MSAEYLNAIGNRLRAMREARGWTVRDLAERTGGSVSTATISRMERGSDCLLSCVEAVAGAFGISVAALTTEEDAPAQCTAIIHANGVPVRCSMGARHAADWHANDFHGLRWLSRAPNPF
jgi:transcriptional regulator with XRE-family HTH domain